MSKRSPLNTADAGGIWVPAPRGGGWSAGSGGGDPGRPGSTRAGPEGWERAARVRGVEALTGGAGRLRPVLREGAGRRGGVAGAVAGAASSETPAAPTLGPA